jgi:hypothetical protein
MKTIAGKIIINTDKLNKVLIYCIKKELSSKTFEGRRFWSGLYKSIMKKYTCLLRGETI